MGDEEGGKVKCTEGNRSGNCGDWGLNAGGQTQVPGSYTSCHLRDLTGFAVHPKSALNRLFAPGGWLCHFKAASCVNGEYVLTATCSLFTPVRIQALGCPLPHASELVCATGCGPRTRARMMPSQT